MEAGGVGALGRSQSQKSGPQLNIVDTCITSLVSVLELLLRYHRRAILQNIYSHDHQTFKILIFLKMLLFTMLLITLLLVTDTQKSRMHHYHMASIGFRFIKFCWASSYIWETVNISFITTGRQPFIRLEDE